MPKRPTQHITESQSRKIFESLLPDEWIFHPLSPDYGLDYMVEIFRNGQTTGEIFFVQLKGTIKQVENDKARIVFDVEHLKYYESHSNPVLIVVCGITTRKCWAVWANALLQSVTIPKKQKQIQLVFDSDKLIDPSFFKNLGEIKKISDKVNLTFTYDHQVGEMIQRKLFQRLNYLYGDSLVVNSNNLPSGIHLIYLYNDQDSKLSIEVKLGSTKLVTLPEISCTENDSLFNRPLFSLDDLLDLRLDDLTIICCSFIYSKNIDSTLEILTTIIPRYKGELLSIEFLVSLSMQALRANKFTPICQMFFLLIASKRFHEAQFINLSFLFLTSENPKFRGIYQQNLYILIDSVENDETRAKCCYNLANSLNGEPVNDPEAQRIAIKNYFRSARLDPEYKTRDYWCREVAGALFRTEHYKFAETNYLRTKSLGQTDRIIDVLIADCRFFQGRFQEASDGFKEFIKVEDDNNDEWILKEFVARHLIAMELSDKKRDRKSSIQLCEDAIQESNLENSIDILWRAIELDPVNGLAWYNLAVNFDKAARHREAMLSFLATCLIQDWDKEAWFQCFIRALYLGEMTLVVPLVKTMHARFTDNIINEFYDFIMSMPSNLGNSQKKKLVEAFTLVLDQIEVVRRQKNEK